MTSRARSVSFKIPTAGADILVPANSIKPTKLHRPAGDSQHPRKKRTYPSPHHQPNPAVAVLSLFGVRARSLVYRVRMRVESGPHQVMPPCRRERTTVMLAIADQRKCGSSRVSRIPRVSRVSRIPRVPRMPYVVEPAVKHPQTRMIRLYPGALHLSGKLLALTTKLLPGMSTKISRRFVRINMHVLKRNCKRYWVVPMTLHLDNKLHRIPTLKLDLPRNRPGSSITAAVLAAA